MDDYPELAARVAAGVGGVRGCLILSRHGLVLGAHPDGDENVAKPSWLRFAVLGEPERSFVEFADQTWVYVHRGPYAAFAVADAGVRPGLLIDQLERALLTAEESRTKREDYRSPEVAGTPPGGPRSPLHPATPAGSKTDAPVIVPVSAAVEREGAPATAADGSRTETPALSPEPAPSEPSKHETPKLMTTPVTPDRNTQADEEAEVDKVMLAQEFGGLLQELRSDDEATS